VANSVDWQKAGENWKDVPDNKLFVIDLTTNPSAQIATVEVGKQPSRLSINKAGNLALVANRADNSISVLSISGKDVKLIDTVPTSRSSGWRRPRRASALSTPASPSSWPASRRRCAAATSSARVFFACHGGAADAGAPSSSSAL
jgi:hypothetical protein